MTLFLNDLIVENPELLKELRKVSNSLFSIVFPFDKILICRKCESERLARNESFEFNRDGTFSYQGFCPCEEREGERVELLANDRPAQVPSRLGIIRWPALCLEAKVNPMVPGVSEYYFRVPRSVRESLAAGDRLLASTLPFEIINAARLQKRLKLAADNLFTAGQIHSFAAALSAKVFGDPSRVETFIRTKLSIQDSWWVDFLHTEED